MNIEQEHINLVAALAKPGDEILNTLDAAHCHLLHMVIGVAGEMLEFNHAAYNRDYSNILEEAGDIEFYLRGIEDAYGFDVQKYEHHEGEKPDVNIDAMLAEFNYRVNHLVDLIKKQIIYRKPISATDICEALDAVRYQGSWVYGYYGNPRERVLTANIHKLSKWYSSGTYSDQQAQDRADKDSVN